MKNWCRKSKSILETSDLLLAIFDGSKPLTKDDLDILKEIENKKSIIIINKEDLPMQIEKEKFSRYKTLQISIKENKGINDIIEEIKSLFNLNELETQDFTYLSNARQINLIKNCLSLSEEINKQNEKIHQ